MVDIWYWIHHKAQLMARGMTTGTIDVKLSSDMDFPSHAFFHDDVIKWRHFPRYWSIVRGMHRTPVYSPHKGQWSRALLFSLICAWINGGVNNRKAGDLRRHRAHYDVILMPHVTLNWYIFVQIWKCDKCNQYRNHVLCIYTCMCILLATSSGY